jgi:hypothetical protein
MSYEVGAPISLAKDITIALIERNSLAMSPEAAKWAGETYKTVLKSIMEAANDPKAK